MLTHGSRHRSDVTATDIEQMRLWDQARMMGSYAAYCMLDRGDELEAGDNFELFTHVTKFFGYQVILLGLYNAQGLGDDHDDLIRIDPGMQRL